jgi:dTDP-4-dehydrorhamnose 3,5-epimerase
MTFEQTLIASAFLIYPEVVVDERGAFVHLLAERELEMHGVTSRFVRSALSLNRTRGTIRGFHLQMPPHADAKLVTCVRGSIFDVIADLRTGSSTYKVWQAFELSAGKAMLYIPEGVAHAFQTLEDDTMVLYHLSEYHVPEASTGLRWDDPALGVQWPLEPTVISATDRTLGTLQAPT